MKGLILRGAFGYDAQYHLRDGKVGWSMGNVENRIDAFVFYVNRNPKKAVGAETPPSVRVGVADESGRYAWAVKSCPAAEWVARFEEQAKLRLPRFYRVLVTRWIFPSFEVRLGGNGLRFWGNTPEGTDPGEWRLKLVKGKSLAVLLLERGFLQFGSSDAGRFADPICFDLKRRRGDGDCPVVRIDRGSSLRRNKPMIVEECAPTFRELLEAVMNGAAGVDGVL